MASTTDEEARPKRRRRREVDVDALESRLGLTFDEEEAARVSRVVRRLSPSGLEFAADLERERGMLVRGAFAAHAAVGALAAAWSFLSPERVSAQPLVLTATASLVVLTLVAWLGPCYRHTRGWGIAEVPYTESQVVWGFFNPLVVWIRPYRALVQLHRASDPDLLPLAPQISDAPRAASYRQSSGLTRTPRMAPRDLRFPVGLFWLLHFLAIPDAFPVPLALRGALFTLEGSLGILVVSAIVRRRQEQMTRVGQLLREAAKV